MRGAFVFTEILEDKSLSLGVMMVGGAQGRARREDDFYPTPPEATDALLSVILDDIKGKIVHEPACGDGAISKVLSDNQIDVISTDLIYRGYGNGDIDFLKSVIVADVIITNPPFFLAEEFIRKAVSSPARRVYMLLKATYFHAKERTDLFNEFPPSRVMPLNFRLDFTGEGKPTMECVWVEWDKDTDGITRYGPILGKISDVRCRLTIDMFR
jgi:hypothetical protein